MSVILHDTPAARCASILLVAAAVCFEPAAAQQLPGMPDGFSTDPAQVRLETSDLHRLAGTLACAGAGAEDTIRAIESEYLGNASPGLRAWVTRYDVTAESIRDAIRAHPSAYADPAGLARDVLEQERPLRAGFRRFVELVPDAVFPPVWFFAGHHQAGGLARPEGVLVAAERFAARPADLVPIVLHELAHFNSALLQGVEVYRRVYGPDQTLLALALREGSADLIAELTTGRHTNEDANAYGLAHERELWRRFREEMHRRDPGDWMFVRPADPERPADLGYWIGYRIARSYYDRAHDKRQAVLDLLNLTDFSGFLAASGYAERLDP